MFSKTHLVWFCLAGAAWLGCSDETGSGGSGGQSAGGASTGGANTGAAGTGGQTTGGASTGGASAGGAGTGGQGGGGLDATPCVTACEGLQLCEGSNPTDCTADCATMVQTVTAMGCETQYLAAFDCVNGLVDICTAPNDCINESLTLDQCLNP